MMDFGSVTPEQMKKFYPTTDHPNYLPVGWTEMTEKEFAQSPFFTYNSTAIEYRQVWYNQDGTKLKNMLAIRLYYHNDGQGFAIRSDFYGEKIHYYRFGCHHEYNYTENLGRCFNRYVCAKCGHVHDIDSSD